MVPSSGVDEGEKPLTSTDKNGMSNLFQPLPAPLFIAKKGICLFLARSAAVKAEVVLSGYSCLRFFRVNIESDDNLLKNGRQLL